MDVREKLVELISKAKAMYADDYTDHTEDEYIAETLLDNSVTVQEWISVKDRLPDKDGSYLILNKRKYIFDAEYESIYKSFGCWHEFIDGAGNEWIAYKEITHWMPLPQPPKED